MFQFRRFPPYAYLIQRMVHGLSPMWIAPFGNLRIKAHFRLPAAYRRSLRPSSAPSAKAFALRPYLLDLMFESFWFSLLKLGSFCSIDLPFDGFTFNFNQCYLRVCVFNLIRSLLFVVQFSRYGGKFPYLWWAFVPSHTLPFGLRVPRPFRLAAFAALVGSIPRVTLRFLAYAACRGVGFLLPFHSVLFPFGGLNPSCHSPLFGLCRLPRRWLLAFMPLGIVPIWWAQVDSNHRPHAYQACALTA